MEIGKWYKFQKVSEVVQSETLSEHNCDDCGTCAQVAMEEKETMVGEIIDRDERVEYLCPQ